MLTVIAIWKVAFTAKSNVLLHKKKSGGCGITVKIIAIQLFGAALALFLSVMVPAFAGFSSNAATIRASQSGWVATIGIIILIIYAWVNCYRGNDAGARNWSLGIFLWLLFYFMPLIVSVFGVILIGRIIYVEDIRYREALRKRRGEWQEKPQPVELPDKTSEDKVENKD